MTDQPQPPDLDAEDIRTTAHNALNPVAVSGA